MRQSIFWRVYFFLFILSPLAGFCIPFLPSLLPQYGLEFNAEDVGTSLLAGIELLGLYGYMYSRQIGSRAIWKIVFAVSVSISVYSAYMSWRDTDLQTLEIITPTLGIAIAVLMFGLLVPLWFALYRYVWTERQIWASGI
ncbi:MAG: hypothetical protein IPP88_12770 [Betaproteobacteria bacterium]|nr:hypothetical protein [Betaproteobacteria bacterium]